MTRAPNAFDRHVARVCRRALRLPPTLAQSATGLTHETARTALRRVQG